MFNIKKFFIATLLLSTALFVSCVSFTFGKRDWDDWTDQAVRHASGDIIFSQYSEIPFSYSTSGELLVEATLSTFEYTRTILMAVDTGAPGNYIDQSLLSLFPDAEDSNYRFASKHMLDIVSTSGDQEKKDKPSTGKFFQSLEVGTVYFEKPLFEPFDFSSLAMKSKDGRPVQGVIGMDLLSKQPFIIYMNDQRIVFTNTEPDWTDAIRTELSEKSIENLRVETSFTMNDGKVYPCVLDTGACYSIFRNKIHKKYLKKHPNKGLKEKLAIPFFVNYQTLVDTIQFNGYEFYDVLALSSIIENALGMFVIGNFDIYVDYHGRKLLMRHIDNPRIEEFRANYLKEKNRAFRKTFGFEFFPGYDPKRIFVMSTFYIGNRKKIAPKVKFIDELISINGKTLDQFDWTSWHDLDEADFVFRRKNKDFSLHLKRQGIEGL